MQLFSSSTRIRKEHPAGSSTGEPQGAQMLLSGVQSGDGRLTGSELVASRRTVGAVVAFTSANPREGVSHVVQFFAEKLAGQTGKPTLVVKAERLPGLRFTDLMDMPGMDMKVGDLWPAPKEARGSNNGRGNGNGKSLDHEEPLETKTGLDLIHALRARLGYTLIDCPAISASHEVAMLAPDVDGVVLVVEADRTKRDQILRATQTIVMAKGNLMGLVLNRRRHVVPELVYRRL